MHNERCCCCNIVTGAAIIGMIQLIIIVTSLATSGVILNRWEVWEEWYGEGSMGEMADKMRGRMEEKMMELKAKVMEKTNMTAAEFKEMWIRPNGTAMPQEMKEMKEKLEENKSKPMKERRKRRRGGKHDDEQKGEWAGAMLEIELANHLAVLTIWLVAIIIYAAAFKYWKAVFVLPNLILQIMMLIFIFFSIIGLACRLAEGPPSGGGNNGMDDIGYMWSSGEYDEEVDSSEEMGGYMMIKTKGGNRNDKEHHRVVLGFFLGMTVIFFFVELVFTVIIKKFYSHLKVMAGIVFPGMPPPIAMPEKVPEQWDP